MKRIVMSPRMSAHRGAAWMAGASLLTLSLLAAPAAYAQETAPSGSAGAQSPAADNTAPPQTGAAGNQSLNTDTPVGDNAAPGAPEGAPPGDELVVTGVRASLRSAQTIKRNSDQIVDSIVAEDIGKLPDRNVAEALQRVPGIQIQRNYGEGSSVAIRGLTQVRTEINGRDSFTASGGNSLSFEDVPSELLAGVDVYKNPASDQIEDQIGGLINLRTRKPFDFDGLKMSGSLGYRYFDLAGAWRPQGSVLLSDRWNTGIGEIGLLADVSYQKSQFRQDTISTEPFYLLSPADTATYFPSRAGQTTVLPHGTGIGEVLGDRRRLGMDFAAQWRPSDKFELTAEVLRSDYKFRFYDYSFFAYTSGDAIIPAAGLEDQFTFADNGDFESGTFQNVNVGSNTSLATRRSITTDYSLNAKWSPTANLTVTADAQYVRGTTKELRSIVALTSTAPFVYQNISGAVPIIHIGGNTAFTGDYLTDPNNYSLGYYLDHIDESLGEDKVGRIDAEYRFDSGFIKSVKAGFRYADRTNRTYDSPYNFYGFFRPLTSSDYEVADLSDFFRGSADLFGNVLAFPMATTKDYEATRQQLGLTADQRAVYTQSALNKESQKTYAGYVMAKFASDNPSFPLDGTMGVRIVRTEEAASGYYQQTYFTADPANPGQYLQQGPVFSPIDFNRDYTSILPSLNLRYHITDQLQLRIAASKGLARPSFGQLNPSLNIGEPNPLQPYGTLTASGGNPYLRELKADQFDTSLEWYFSRTGSLTGALFYKKVRDFIQTNTVTRDVTFPNGNTYPYEVSSYLNGDNGVIKGFEVAYNQFFDFLPGPFSGLGAQANFTYVDSKAPSPTASDTSGNSISVPLELLSKYSYNLVGIYEKGPISARVAYNWRSKYVITTAGNGTGNLPVINKPFGQLDASITYNLTNNVSLTIDGTNILNTRRATYFGVDTRPRDVTLNDRIFSGVIRVTF